MCSVGAVVELQSGIQQTATEVIAGGADIPLLSEELSQGVWISFLDAS